MTKWSFFSSWNQTNDIKITFNPVIFVKKINFHIIEIRHSNTHIRNKKSDMRGRASKQKKATMKNMNKENKANNFLYDSTCYSINAHLCVVCTLVTRQICVSLVFAFSVRVLLFFIRFFLILTDKRARETINSISVAPSFGYIDKKMALLIYIHAVKCTY